MRFETFSEHGRDELNPLGLSGHHLNRELCGRRLGEHVVDDLDDRILERTAW